LASWPAFDALIVVSSGWLRLPLMLWLPLGQLEDP